MKALTPRLHVSVRGRFGRLDTTVGGCHFFSFSFSSLTTRNVACPPRLQNKFSSHPLASSREYQCRKNRNEGKGDAVYSNLAYLPVCNCMPVCKNGCRNPFFMWTKKGTH